MLGKVACFCWAIQCEGASEKARHWVFRLVMCQPWQSTTLAIHIACLEIIFLEFANPRLPRPCIEGDTNLLLGGFINWIRPPSRAPPSWAKQMLRNQKFTSKTDEFLKQLRYYFSGFVEPAIKRTQDRIWLMLSDGWVSLVRSLVFFERFNVRVRHKRHDIESSDQWCVELKVNR